MGNITKPYGDFTNNVDVADATKVNAQMNLLYNTINGGIDATNAPTLGYAITAISANTNLTTSQVGIIECTAGSAGITVTLPSAASSGLRFILKKVDSGSGVVTINTTSSQTIDGVNSRSLVNQYAEIHVISNGSNWDVVIENIVDLPTFSIYRQAIINGNFDVWQRGTSFTNPASNSYGADRWKIGFDGTGQAATVSQQAFTIGQTSVPKEPKFFYRYQVTTAATGQTFNTIQQLIESVRTFAGQKCTLSFWAKADASRTIIATLRQFFGTGGTPSASVDTSSSSFSLTTSWQKFTYTFNLPSISGKTLGTNGDDSLQLFLFLPTNSPMTIDIAQVQVNAGDQALQVQPRSFAEELALCQRYYEKSYDYAVIPGTASNSGIFNLYLSSIQNTFAVGSVPFKVQKRISGATATVYSPLDGTAGKYTIGGINKSASISAGQSSLSVLQNEVSTNSGNAQFQWTVDAEL